MTMTLQLNLTNAILINNTSCYSIIHNQIYQFILHLHLLELMTEKQYNQITADDDLDDQSKNIDKRCINNKKTNKCYKYVITCLFFIALFGLAFASYSLLQIKQLKANFEKTSNILKIVEVDLNLYMSNENIKNKEEVFPSTRNSRGQRVEEYLYGDPKIIAERTKFIYERNAFIQQQVNNHPEKDYQNLLLATRNLKLNAVHDKQLKAMDEKQYLRLDALYNLSEVKEQLSMCLLAVGRNNNKEFRIEANLNSIFGQNYSNYLAVFMDDNSDDGSDQIYNKYFQFYDIPKDKYLFIENKERFTTLKSYHNAVHDYCKDYDIFLTIDQDDQIIGWNSLKLLNAFYLRGNYGLVYSNFYFNYGYNQIKIGHGKPYTEEDIKSNNFRKMSLDKCAHLRSGRIQLYKKIKLSDLQWEDGTFFQTVSDRAIFNPIEEMSCGKIKHIPQILYFYNYMTGSNDYINGKIFRAEEIKDRIKNAKKYECVAMENFKPKKK